MKKQNKMPPRQVRLEPTQVRSADVVPPDFPTVESGKGIKEGYGEGAVRTLSEVNAMVRATMGDFKANISYEVAMPVGAVNVGTPEAPILEQAFLLKKKYADEKLLSSALDEYENYVRAGNAYNVQGGGGGTTVPPVGGTTVPPATTVPPGGGPVLVDPVTISHVQFDDEGADKVIVEEGSGAWAQVLNYPTTLTGHPKKVTVERPAQIKTRGTNGELFSYIWNVYQYDKDGLLIDSRFNIMHLYPITILPNARDVLLAAKSLRYISSVSPGGNNLRVTAGNSYYGLGGSHWGEISNAAGQSMALRMFKPTNSAAIKFIIKPAVVLPFDIKFFNEGVQVGTTQQVTADDITIAPADIFWDTIVMGPNAAIPVPMKLLTVQNRINSDTGYPRIKTVRLGGNFMAALGYPIGPNTITVKGYKPETMANKWVQPEIEGVPVGETVCRVIDSAGTVYELPYTAPGTLFFDVSDISNGVQLFLIPSGTPLPPTTVPETTTVPPTTVPETTTIPPPPPEITTTVPEVTTTTVPETTVPPTTVVVAAANGNGDELKELDQLVEKELQKKKTTTKKK